MIRGKRVFEVELGDIFEVGDQSIVVRKATASCPGLPDVPDYGLRVYSSDLETKRIQYSTHWREEYVLCRCWVRDFQKISETPSPAHKYGRVETSYWHIRIRFPARKIIAKNYPGLVKYFEEMKQEKAMIETTISPNEGIARRRKGG